MDKISVEKAMKLLRGGDEGIQEWNKLRIFGAEIPHLIRADLSGANLSGARLIQVHLEGANLEGADLRRANLEETHLFRANLFRADLRGANLRGANLEGAFLAWARLERANLNNANLEGATLARARLEKANLARARLEKANLDNANLEGADLEEANLGGANLVSANLGTANLTGADFKRALFSRTVLDNDLSQAKRLDLAGHRGRSVLSFDSIISFTADLPEHFLKGCGIQDEDIEYFRGRIGSPNRFYSGFISYSHANKTIAHRIHNDLQAEGIRCWLDEHQLLPGDDVHESVNQAIRLWDKLLLFCSKESLTSWCVDTELESAFAKEDKLFKQYGSKILAVIPIDLDGFVFQGWQSEKKVTIERRFVADFKGWSDPEKYTESLAKLVRAMKTEEFREKPPPSAFPQPEGE